MSWWSALGVGLCAGLVGTIVGFAVATAIIEWFRIPAREGIAGLVGMAIIVLVLVSSVILGIVCARHVGAGGAPSFLKAFGQATAIIVAVGLLAVAICWLFAAPRSESEVPAEKTGGQIAAEDAARADAALAALTPENPLGDWLVFTRYGNSKARIERASAAIRSRPTFVAEMTHAMLEADPTISRDALNAFEHFDPPPLELDGAVREVGKRIAAALRDFGAMPADDPARRAAADAISATFSAWVVAAGALQAQGAIGYVDELQEIANLARASQDDFVIRMSIVRVASFYLQQWAGIAPLPDDPPPR